MTQSSTKKPWHILRLPMPWHRPIVRPSIAPEGRDIVILIHGLWRSMWAMDPMAESLHAEGFHTINVPYPSFRKSIQDCAALIEQTIRDHDKGGKVHFVTHSLGGIITRHILAALPKVKRGQVVMLAPPNQGSEVSDWLNSMGPVKFCLGPAGRELGQKVIDAPGLPDQSAVLIIMGKRSTIPFFRHLLEEENDGIVSVGSGKIDGMTKFHVVDLDHTFIAADASVMKMTAQWLNEPMV